MQGSGAFFGELELHVSGSGPALVAVHDIQGTLETRHGTLREAPEVAAAELGAAVGESF